MCRRLAQRGVAVAAVKLPAQKGAVAAVKLPAQGWWVVSRGTQSAGAEGGVVSRGTQSAGAGMMLGRGPKGAGAGRGGLKPLRFISNRDDSGIRGLRASGGLPVGAEDQQATTLREPVILGRTSGKRLFPRGNVPFRRGGSAVRKTSRLSPPPPTPQGFVRGAWALTTEKDAETRLTLRLILTGMASTDHSPIEARGGAVAQMCATRVGPRPDVVPVVSASLLARVGRRHSSIPKLNLRMR